MIDMKYGCGYLPCLRFPSQSQQRRNTYSTLARVVLLYLMDAGRTSFALVNQLGMSNKNNRLDKRPVVGTLLYMCSSPCQSSPECKITENVT
jgi:hypothetical protein